MERFQNINGPAMGFDDGKRSGFHNFQLWYRSQTTWENLTLCAIRGTVENLFKKF